MLFGIGQERGLEARHQAPVAVTREPTATLCAQETGAGLLMSEIRIADRARGMHGSYEALAHRVRKQTGHPGGGAKFCIQVAPRPGLEPGTWGFARYIT